MVFLEAKFKTTCLGVNRTVIHNWPEYRMMTVRFSQIGRAEVQSYQQYGVLPFFSEQCCVTFTWLKVENLLTNYWKWTISNSLKLSKPGTLVLWIGSLLTDLSCWYLKLYARIMLQSYAPKDQERDLRDGAWRALSPQLATNFRTRYQFLVPTYARTNSSC